MAKLRSTSKKNYPRLAAFLPIALREAHETPLVLKAFLDYSQLSPAAAKNALTRFDTDPVVEIEDLGPGTNGRGDPLGRFYWDDPDAVILAVDVARQFERDFELKAAQRTVAAVVLHEMVHWGDRFDGRRQGGEPGELFEYAAYRQLLDRWYVKPPHATAQAVADGRRLMFPVTGRIGSGASYWGEGIRVDGGSHDGIDIFNDIGAPVHAVADGEVVGGDRYRKAEPYVSESGEYGQMIDIDHGNGLVSRYAHLATIEVSPGPVRQGARIGTLGATGTEWGAWLASGQPESARPATATSPHLHFEMRRSDGQAFGRFEDTYDPATFFPFIAAGRGARNTVVSALAPGRLLDEPVPRAPDLQDGRDLDLRETPIGHRSAYPNLTFRPNDPRGLRNNNPGNIKKDTTLWAGLRTPDLQLDSVFFQFIAMEWGIRAMARILRTYEVECGVRTVRDMSSRWAPVSDNNDAEAHATNVLAGAAGAFNSIDQPISFTDPNIAFAVIRGIALAENGPLARQIPDRIVRLGISLETTS